MSEKIMDKVAKLIRQAESEAKLGNEIAAETFLARADALMVKHAIDAAMVASRVQDRVGVEREKPENRTLPFVPYSVDFYWEYETMLGAIAQHCRVRIMTRPSYQESTSHVVVIGFPSDLDYMQLLWNSVYFAFISKLNPTWQADRPADENIKILKEAGWKWGRIAIEANHHGFECTANDGRLKSAYRRQCKLEGVEPTSHTQRHQAYRAAYAEGFESMISTRLWRMKRAAEKQVDDTPGSALALRDRAADVNEAFFEMFPSQRPPTPEERERYMANLRARNAAAEREEQERRAKLTPEQQAAEDRREARAARQADRRAQREAARTNDDAGRRAGQSAASTVDLGGAKVASNAARGIRS